MNPQLLNTITAEFDKVDGDAVPEPSRTSADLVSMISSSSSKAQIPGLGDPLDDLFPRVEIDSLLKGTTILSDAKSDSWKTKKEALETLQAILDQGSNKRLKGTMGARSWLFCTTLTYLFPGEIGQVLKARVTDTNKSVQSLALDIVCRISTGMEKPFEKHVRLFVLPVSTVLADQKAPIRSAALQALTAMAMACNGLESMVSGLTTALETSNPLQKGTLLHWLADWFKDKEPASTLDLNSWVSPVVACLDDRNSDVRKGAQALLPILITCAGFDYVLQQTNSLKPASRASAVPLIQAARPAPSSVLAPKPAPVTIAPSIDPPESPISSSMPPPKAKVTGVRRKLPQGSSRPESRAQTPIETIQNKASVKPALENQQRAGGSILSTAPPLSLPFHGTNMDLRKTRTGKDSNRWVNEGGPTRKDLADLLQSQMETHTSKELIARLFSHDHNAVNDHIQGLNSICEIFSGAEDESAEAIVCLANFDLVLKYVSIKAHEPQPNLMSKCLEAVETVLAFLLNANYQLTDGEATCFIPTMIYKANINQIFILSHGLTFHRSLGTLGSLSVFVYNRLFEPFQRCMHIADYFKCC